MIWLKKIDKHELGLVFQNGEFKELITEGRHLVGSIFSKTRTNIVNIVNYRLKHSEIDKIVKSGIISDNIAHVLSIKDNERAIVWKDDRIDGLLPAGNHILWKGFYKIKVEIVDIKNVKFTHNELNLILQTEGASLLLNEFIVEEGHSGLMFQNSVFMEELKPGRYAFWKDVAKVKLFHKDKRNQMEDISGQEIMTADRVSLRINATVHYNIEDALKVVTKVENLEQALYREAQSVLRAVVGTRDLEQLLTDKNSVTGELEDELSKRIKNIGLQVSGFGIKDIILPGDMKDLLNRVIEAKKQAEANFISRREETAAIRNQVNTAKILENNPTLMRLKELEILEKVALNTNLQILLGEEGLTKKVMKLL